MGAAARRAAMLPDTPDSTPYVPDKKDWWAPMKEAWLRRQLRRLLPTGSLRDRLATGILWSLAAAVVGQGTALVVAVATARILGPEGFGELAIVNSTMGMLGIFGGVGLGLTATKFVAELKRRDPARVARILSLLNRAVLASGGLAATVMFLLAPWLADRILDAPHLVNELRIGCLLLLFNEIAGVQTASLAGYEAFRQIARVALIRGLVSVPVAILGAALFGLMGAVVALVLGAAVGLVLGRIALVREHARWGVGRAEGSVRAELPILWRYSLPAFLGSVLVGPVGWAGNALLVNQPSGYAALGVFNAANQWRTSVLFMPTVIGQAAMPIMASLLGSGGSRPATRIFLASVVGSAAVALPIAAVLLLAREPLMGLYGPGFAPHGAVLGLVAITVVVISLQLPVGQLLAASGRMWLGAALNFGWSLVFVVSALALVPTGLGAVGLAAAYLIAYAIHTFGTLIAGWIVVRSTRTSAEEVIRGAVGASDLPLP